MTDEELLAQLMALPYNQGDWDQDQEKSHSLADNLLCNVLKSLGFVNSVAFYEKQTKWYA